VEGLDKNVQPSDVADLIRAQGQQPRFSEVVDPKEVAYLKFTLAELDAWYLTQRRYREELERNRDQRGS
jgi:hypothetical protein